MILSHRYKFIFIKTRKTAGTSLEVYLSQICGPEDVVTPIIPHVEPHAARNHKGLWLPFRELFRDRRQPCSETISDLRRRRRFYNHIPASTARQRIPKKIWDTYYKFAIDRNPWDKAVSFYHMKDQRSEEGLTLDVLLRQNKRYANYPLYSDDAGASIVDRVIRYENLNSELGEIFDQLGVPFDGTLGVRAKSEHRKDRRSYRDVLTNEQAQTIREVCKQEIELHGYEF